MMLLGVAVGIAALGLIAHNLMSLPLSHLAPETVGPVLVYVAHVAYAAAQLPLLAILGRPRSRWVTK